jgi:uncharacterized secreted protein with C-terminal beta-propeller domain
MKKKAELLSRDMEKTIIHKIGIDKSKLEHKAVGEVTGSVLNQFSMDEKDDFFRIATTKNRLFFNFSDKENTSDNNLYVLDSNLKVVGNLEKLANGERIYSVRFMQNRAYMVTFKQTDPLFVIDLSDNNNPRVLGELKIPGYSSYLHPYDEKTLIGLGKETTTDTNGNVTTKGLKISLFDVENPIEPRELMSYSAGSEGSDSMALYDHKAFLFSKEKELLVIPASLTKLSADSRYRYNIDFNGALVFKITKDKIELKGKISHPKEESKNVNDYWYYDSGNAVKRSLYIENNLYTVSENYLKINDLGDLKDVKILNMDLNKKSGGDFEVIN